MLSFAHSWEPTLICLPSLPSCTSSSKGFRIRKHRVCIICWCGVIEKNISPWSIKRSDDRLAKNLACEWGKDNIRANAVAPWYVKTSLVEQVLKNKDYYEEVISCTPLRRIGDPKEVSSLVASLRMTASSYITGQIVCVDSGFNVMALQCKLKRLGLHA